MNPQQAELVRYHYIRRSMNTHVANAYTHYTYDVYMHKPLHTHTFTHTITYVVRREHAITHTLHIRAN